ncbi:hypothetical protein BJ944DRAFT_261379 [Cunninghamella echinulata]|nr:hypothetical protein BJ944DRAFT_261379 [Cunninghamella echinulata]
MLEFQKEILTRLVEEDSLVILSPGLGLFKLFCSFLELYCNDNHLVLVINTTPNQDVAIQDRLASQGIPKSKGLKTIEYGTSSDTRETLYRNGGIFSITSRILTVDLLLKRVPTALISGIVVYNAHKIRPHSMEELILQIYREENEQGFIKAFSDQPEAFTTGFAPLQNTLKTLQLRSVQLWPRFQVSVSSDLSRGDEEVVELRLPMTESMEQMQQALIECMEVTLSEVKKSNSKVDMPNFTLENSFFKSFDTIVRRQLDPIWHHIGPNTKQLVGDLKIIRQLLTYLTNYDCVTFNSFLEAIITSNSSSTTVKQIKQSQWLFLDAADRLIKIARKRVYLQPSDPEYESIDESNQIINDIMPYPIRTVLEELPKWKLLQDILEEIEQDDTINTNHGTPVLVMVKEQRTCSQLKDYISQKQQLLQKLSNNYFNWRREIQRIQKSALTNNSQTSQQQNQQQESAYQRKYPPNKRRRIRGGSTTASNSRSNVAQSLRDELIGAANNVNTPESTSRQNKNTDINISEDADEDDDDKDFVMDNIIANLELNKHDILPKFDQVSPGSMVSIQCYDNDVDEQLLDDYKPRYIIMYDPDPSFIRRIEVYRASNPSLKVRVYFMVYDNSVEEQKYLSLIRKEKEAFEKLIREKSVMAIPIRQKKTEKDDLFIRTVSSRYGGGQLKLDNTQTVIVDMREFRSSLPPIMYAEGLKIIPCTLQVGDYILAPNICVERKSINDLIQSLNTGRLYSQCENMKLHYEIPILLIEFDEDKSFSIQNVSDIKENIVATDLSSKLTLLTLAFPGLRIIWSSSPHETTKIFKELKESHNEPNVEEASLIGTENINQPSTTINATPEDILRSLPGVTSKNYHLIMKQVNSLQELASMEEKQIQEIIGIEPGKKLYQFIHQKN